MTFNSTAIDRKALEDLQNSTIFNAAETDFNESIKALLSEKAQGAVKYDPRELDPQISNYKDLFERLKFLFLEQEAKEKFLRRILGSPSVSVDKADIQNASEKIQEWKQKTEEKNLRIDETVKKLEKQCEEHESKLSLISKQFQKLQEKQQEIKEKADKLEQFNAQIQNIKETDDLSPKLQELLSKDPNLNSESLEINSIDQMQKLLDEKSKLLQEKTEELTKLQEEITSKNQYLQNNKKDYQKILKEDKELSEKLEIIANQQTNNDQDPNTVAQLTKHENLKILMSIWFQISNIKEFEFDESDLLHYKYKDSPETKILIKFNSNTGLIEWIRCDLVHDDKLKELVSKSNKSKNPIFQASQSLYDEITAK